MQVRDLMTEQVRSCHPNDSLEHAARLMWDHDFGSMPVCADDGLQRAIGMITDRDICMCAMFQRKPLQDLRVREAMARQLTACHPEDSLAQAERAMRDARIRRLPVLGDNGALVGVLSLADLVMAAARERTRFSKDITDAEVSQTLAAICGPTGQTLVV